MGSKNTLKRLKENEGCPNVNQPTREGVLNNFKYKRNWNTLFKNNHPVILKLGCGKGEYSIALARKYPDKNFIGIDIKGARFWRGAKTAIDEKIENVLFLRTQIELLASIFEENEVAEIWITFPDPQIKYRRTKHRLVNPDFLRMYQKVLKKDGIIHLKTDSEFLHGYLLGVLQEGNHHIDYAHHDVYNSTGAPEEVTSVQTFYEKQYLDQQKRITYVRFKTNY